MIEAVATALLPLRVGELEVITDVSAFVNRVTGTEYVAVVFGGPALTIEAPVLVRVHSGCLTGDVLSSLRCDCGDQLDHALHQIVAAGAGVVVYAPSHEGRGIGIANKIRAYALQDGGLDTVDANEALGLAVDGREFDDVGTILHLLGVESIRLLTNNPTKVASLESAGLQVEQVAMPLFVNRFNAGYLATKRERLGHLLGPTTEEAPGRERSLLR